MDVALTIALACLGLGLSLSALTTVGRIHLSRAQAKEAERARALECPHAWSLWSIYKKGPLVTAGTCVGYYTVQVRDCAICGLKEYKRSET